MLYNGGQRRLVTQGWSNLSSGDGEDFVVGQNLSFVHHFFMNGRVQRVTTNGIGCTLMKVNAIRNIPFRHVANNDAAPDTWFTKDLIYNKIPYYVHTGLRAYHWNTEDWLEYASLLKQNKNE